MAPSKITNVAIVGASGNVGSHIVTALLAKQQFKITAISRVDSKATFAEGITVARVDYDKPDTIVEALKGQDAFIITMNVMAAKDTSQKLIRAAADAGVPWVLPNEFGMFTTEDATMDTVGPQQGEDRKLVEDLGVSSWIGVTSGFWYEHSLSGPGFYGAYYKTREMVFFDDGTEPLNTSTWPQVGRAVAALLSLPVTSQGSNEKTPTLDTYRNRRVFVSSFTVTQRDMFESLKRVTGTTDSDWKISSVSSKERYTKGRERMMKGDRNGFGEALYARYFYPGEHEKSHPLDNKALRLSTDEDLDEATKDALKLGESGYWKMYGGGTHA